MPLEWSERFGLNVPIIKLGNNISNAEKDIWFRGSYLYFRNN